MCGPSCKLVVLSCAPCRSMLTADCAVSTSQTSSTQRMSFLQSSRSFCLFRCVGFGTSPPACAHLLLTCLLATFIMSDLCIDSSQTADKGVPADKVSRLIRVLESVQPCVLFHVASASVYYRSTSPGPTSCRRYSVQCRALPVNSSFPCGKQM